ncbi:hypothetical protein L204_100182 [Cryptococcus depauperatus]|nr:hypothetical protein L204_02336 [Cryptococcus depauperatus CBS 7855]
MSIPDNPFQASTGTSTPALHIFPAAEDENVGNSTSGSVGSNPSIPPHIQTFGSTSTSPCPVLNNAQPSDAIPAGPGTKTPRRVQWTSDSHIVQLHPIEPASPLPHTLDSSNIKEFRDALERHRHTMDGRHTSAVGGRRPLSQLSRQSSESDTLTTHEEEDYDYRNDDSSPINERSEKQRHASSETNYEQHLIDNGMRDHVPTFIGPDETDGLPNIPAIRQDQNETDAARDLVRAHTGKWGVLRRRVRGAGTAKNAFSLASKGTTRQNDLDPEKNNEERDERASPNIFTTRHFEPRLASAHGTGGAAPGGASILSTLLALYGQRQGQYSGTTSAASSLRESENEYSSDEEQKALYKDRNGWMNAGKRHSGLQDVTYHNEPSADIASAKHADFASPKSSQSPDFDQQASLMGKDDKSGSPDHIGFLQKVKDQWQYARPNAAKNGAGVFGALLQNTQNIAGAATPAASTLAPAAKRPGYQLSRYSLPDVDSDQRTESMKSPWRPPSRPSSRADSCTGSRPASNYSSTTILRDGASPRQDSSFEHKRAKSSDDLIGIRNASVNDSSLTFSKNKRRSALHLENLAHLPMAAVKGSSKSIKNAEKWLAAGMTPFVRTPPEKAGSDYLNSKLHLTEEEKKRKEWEAEKKKRKKAREARKKQEIFIIQHVAAILARQQFLLKLARALMMFGSPSHRLETQIQATAKVLELNCQVVYLPNTMLISFGDDATHTSETKFLKQSTGLDLGKLQATHHLYWNVVHDKMSVDQASKDLDVLMTTPVYYTWWQTLIIGAICSGIFAISGFHGSFVDAFMAMPLGLILVAVQMLAARNDMFSNVFEITIATVISFVSAALASTRVFCYTALVSGGVVLILPGYIVLCGALELASRNITAGAVRIGYSVIYSLFLGFGISIGAVLYAKITHHDVINASDYTCAYTHHSGVPWYMVTPSGWWYFFSVPGASLALSLKNQQPFWAKELPIMVLISCAGWTSNHYASQAFPGRSDMTSAIGSFVVGVLGNTYGRFSNGSSFPVTVTGILFQLPSGLSNGGIFNFAAESSSGSSTAYSDGFSVAEQLVSVAIGLTVGLFVSAAVCHPFGGGRRRGSGIFSF